ncbi:hypothetical protein [Bacillus sp. FJAT-47783]|nr:hypothetical protein [Bacillus sp. FJAT-47783]
MYKKSYNNQNPLVIYGTSNNKANPSSKKKKKGCGCGKKYVKRP